MYLGDDYAMTGVAGLYIHIYVHTYMCVHTHFCICTYVHNVSLPILNNSRVY